MNLSRLRIVDLSVPLEDMAPSEPLPAKIRYIQPRDEGLAQMQQFFGVSPADLVYSDGQGWAVEEMQAITHTGTHVDAPYHYGALSEGQPARTIDQVPLEWCFAPGVLLDMRHKAAGDFITVDDLQSCLDRMEYSSSRSTSSSCRPGPTPASARPTISVSRDLAGKASSGSSNRA